jgi:hypothetical protein
MSFEEHGKSDTVKDPVTDLIQIGKIGTEDNYPGRIPPGIPEEEHPGDDGDRGGINEMLGKHTGKRCPRGINGFLFCR